MKISYLLAIIFIVIYHQGISQIKSTFGGSSLVVGTVQGELANTYDMAVGLYGSTDINLNDHFAIRLDGGWLDLTGPETEYVDINGVTHKNHPERTVYEFSAGMRAKAWIFYLETRGGYLSGVRSWGIMPAVGIRIGPFDMQAGYTQSNNFQMASIRAGWYWNHK